MNSGILLNTENWISAFYSKSSVQALEDPINPLLDQHKVASVFSRCMASISALLNKDIMSNKNDNKSYRSKIQHSLASNEEFEVAWAISFLDQEFSSSQKEVHKWVTMPSANVSEGFLLLGIHDKEQLLTRLEFLQKIFYHDNNYTCGMCLCQCSRIGNYDSILLEALQDPWDSLFFERLRSYLEQINSQHQRFVSLDPTF